MIILVIAVSLLMWLAYRIFKDEFTPLRKIPLASGSVPLFDHALIFRREKNHVKLLQNWSEKHGPIFRYSRGFGESRVFLTDPEFLKHVLVTNAKNYLRSPFLRILLPSLGNGLFSSNGKDHVLQRKMINPAFHYSNLAGLVDDFQELTDNLVNVWTEKVKSSTEGVAEVSIGASLTHLTFDIIGRCAFGYNFNTVQSGENEISKAFSLAIEGVSFAQLVKKKFIPFYSYLPSDENIKEKKAFELTNEIVLKVIRDKHEKRKEGIVSSKRDLLDLLMDQLDEETGVGMDDELLKAEVFTFMLAGHETTSTSMTWTLYELARHPEIAEEIRQEARMVLKDSTVLTWSKLAEMKFLGNVIKESLRRHCPATQVGRIAKEKDVIGGYEIPKGTMVTLGLDAVHLSPKFWKDPFAFDPDRFNESNENTPSMQRYVFAPFSAGPRSCIGNKFAMAEMKAVLCTLVQHFAFEEIPGFTVTPTIRLTMKPDPPLKLRIRKL